MKKLACILLVSLVVACGGGDSILPDDEYPKSNWGRPLSVIEYQDAAGKQVFETTTYYYDHLDRLTGYRSENWYGAPNEEMLKSVYDGKTHTYEIHSYEWVGGSLPVVFLYTDTYTDTSFSTIEKRYMKGITFADWEENITYRYEGGRKVGYRTVVKGQYPDDFETRISYIDDPRPSATSFPRDVDDKANRVERVYLDRNGNRTGYYSDNDYNRAQWNFNYGNGYCTYFTSQFGDVDMPRLTRVVFHSKGK